jgi:mannose-1-phosphate guanylyltransferase
VIHTVIIAGGSGTRFWPASRKALPKQFLAIDGKESMLAQTARRLLPLCGWDRMNVVASSIHVRSIHKVLPELPQKNLLLEPQARNTAPAVALAAMEIIERDPQAVLVVLPADHVIKPAGKFRTLIKRACAVARQGGLVTLGIKPTRAETGYGYIRTQRKSGCESGVDVFTVQAFVEKPDKKKAAQYFRSSKYFWNSGMFVFKVQEILADFERHMPELFHGLQKVYSASAPNRKKRLAKLFESIQGESIDYGIMEKAASIKMLPCDLSWSDVGSWAALPEVLRGDRAGNVCQGDVLTLDTKGCIIHSDKRLVACVGLENMIVVETKDAILVCPVEKAQSVRAIVDALKKSKRPEV